MNAFAHRDVSERTQRAHEALRNCKLCPRECCVDRTSGEKGYCGLDEKVRCFREMLNYYEEQELVPSHHVCFAGCNLACNFCIVAEWNKNPDAADELNASSLARMIAERQQQGARTLNLTGGEPSVSIHGALELLARLSPDTCVVWNSNMYFSPLVVELLEGLVDIYVADFKCGNNRCAEMLLDAKDYVEVVQKNLRIAHNTTGLIVRHVILPGHGECCLQPMLQWLADEMPDVKLSLWNKYVPPAEAGSAPGNYLDIGEVQEVNDFAATLGLNVIE